MNEISLKIGFWYDENKRKLPWRETRDAYRIWLSEIILQQTRVAQGMDYYMRFVAAYPNVEALANAEEDDVLKLWQGLGYYSRARNLWAAARQVVAWNEEAGCEEKSRFPQRYEDLKRLKGVGPYTAVAVASLSGDEEVAVVDGNVYRVLARLLDLDVAIDTGKGQKTFQAVADQLLHEAVAEGHTTPRRHNQAMMEFGALQCTPNLPHCEDCPVSSHCLALANKTVELRPVKQGKLKVKERHFTYIIYIYKDTLWVHQRGAGDIWQGLWEYVLTEDEQKVGICILEKKHQLTHQTLYTEFRVVKLEDDIEDPWQHPAIKALPQGYVQMKWMDWQKKAVPKLIDAANERLSVWF